MSLVLLKQQAVLKQQSLESAEDGTTCQDPSHSLHSPGMQTTSHTALTGSVQLHARLIGALPVGMSRMKGNTAWRADIAPLSCQG